MARQMMEPRAARGQRFRMSYEEYEAWMDENIQSEWVDGEVIIFMPPSARHERVIYLRPDWLWQDPLPDPSALVYRTIAPDLLDLLTQQRAAQQDSNGRE